MEFAEQIMLDLINQGYSGNDLCEHFEGRSEPNMSGCGGNSCGRQAGCQYVYHNCCKPAFCCVHGGCSEFASYLKIFVPEPH